MPDAARFYRVGEPIKIEDNPVPRIKPDEVLLKIRAASVCHSDVHVTSGVIPVNGPIVLGHEIAGNIEELGEKVETIKKGDGAIVHFITPCGDCNYCLTGNSNVCRNINSLPMYGFSADGGYTQYMRVNYKRLVRLPSDVPYEFGASLCCAGITALHAAQSIGKIGLGDTVAVYGTGGVGMYILQIAKLLGATTTIAIGRTAEKLQMAQERFGADATVNLTREKLTDSIKRITGGKGTNAVFDFVVNNESVENSTKILANAGRLILVGIGGEPAVINPKRLTFKEASILGTNVGSKHELRLLVDLARSGKLKGVANTKHRLNEVNEVLTALKAGKILGRAYFDPFLK
ncbi:MAG TPA: alcohol dehydrogenase catalytic domain-containing protein [Nitrososphaeraceae archaeon]|nr:alcohol dehydrogenase catalytic domain-containing protein [Nitrososphaeraceae archaeon]